MEEQIMKEYSKWKSGKRFLTAAITLSLLGSLGLYSPAAYAEEDFEEYTGSITGKEDNASEYVMAHITKDGGKNYKFTDDSLIKTNQGVKVGDLDYPVNIDASGHVLKFYGHVNDKHTLVHAVEANSKKGVTITAKKLIIDAGNTKSRAEGISVGGQGGTNKDAPYRLTINGDTDIRAHGANYGLGMYLCGNAEVTINGNVTMNTHDEKNPWAVYVENDGGFSYYGGSAIYAGNNYELQLGPKLTVNGLVDLKVNANGVFANGGHSDIYFRGGNIEINKDNTKGYYALLAECATTTMNMERDENKVPVRAGSAKVTIKGNVGASAGAINVAEPEPYTRVNLGLATPDSSWTGVAYNAFKDEGNDAGGKKFFGEINLWLQNGASWTNEAWGEPPDAYFGEDFSESHLKRLVGGESADKAGHIFQKPGEDEDSEGINIRVDDYKGFTNIYYGHKEEKPTDILGGTFTVTKAQPGSGINLITDSKGLNVDSSKAADKNLASETLNALANKLFYTAYKNGETNLAGKVEIAEGLTASSLSKRMEDVTFKKEDGQGQYLYTPAQDEIVGPITGPEKETADRNAKGTAPNAKQGNVVSGMYNESTPTTKTNPMIVDMNGFNLNVAAESDNKIADAVYVGNNDYITVKNDAGKKIGITSTNTNTRAANGIFLEGNSHLNITGPVEIAKVHTKGSSAAGIAFQGSGSEAVIDGSLTISNVDGDKAEKQGRYIGVSGIRMTGDNTSMTVTGPVNISGFKGSALHTAGADSVISVGGGQITVPSGMNYGYYTLGAYQGTINVNTGIGGNTPGTADVNLNGDIFVLPTGTVNAAFTTANSRLHGIVDNGGTVNMWLRNGATWTNEARNTRYGEDNEDTGSNGASHITHFYGGDTAAAAGIINQKSDKAITIDHYSGNTTVNFGTLTHNGDGVTISAAADNSAITMSGDRSGLGETEAMERLAGKLTYTAYTSGERNLDGTVKLNEGLTARSVARTGRIDFNGATGKGRLGELSESPLMMKMMAVPSALRTSAVSPAGGLIPTSLPGGVAYILGDRETMMMRGAKSAMTTSMLSWRSGMTDMNQRIGDLRLGASSGIWARTYGGKVKYDKDKTNLSDSFWGTQVGADHKLASGWHIGGAFDYNDGNAKYDFGGKGDPKLYVGSIYGTKVFDDGQYVDIVGKMGRAENDYTVYNAEGRKLDGDYHATGYGLSMEYGKRFGTAAGYVEPQIQLLFSRLGSADYDAVSDFDGDKKMHVHQDSMSSFIGRLGIAAGRATEKGNLYAKASILHEFKGDTAATFSAEGEDTSRVEQDFGDTWAELTLGGVYRLNGSNLFYANVTRGFGGDYKMEWKVNAGLRFAF